jgi:hypothetical protein
MITQLEMLHLGVLSGIVLAKRLWTMPLKILLFLKGGLRKGLSFHKKYVASLPPTMNS